MTEDQGDQSSTSSPVPVGGGGLLLLVGASVAGAALVGIVDPGWEVRLAVGVPLLLFSPGYVTVKAVSSSLSPGTPTELSGSTKTDARAGAELAVYAVGLSLGITPLLGRLLVETGPGFTGRRLLGAVTGYVLLVGTVAAVRRSRTVSDGEPSTGVAPTRRDLFDALPALDGWRTVLVVALVASGVILAIGSVSVAVAGPFDRGAYTELYLLNETEDADRPVATAYPEEVSVGDARSLVVVVENHQNGPRNYTVVAQLQRVDPRTGAVLERQELEQFSARVPDDGALRRTHEVRPQMRGERLQLRYLLFRGEPPGQPSAESAEQSVYLWVNVTASADAGRLPDPAPRSRT